jgi:HK97 gp10 family phage protein
MSRTVVSLSGFRDLDRALAELPKATARNTLKRTLVKAAEPIAERARELVPVDQGQLKASIAVSPRIKNKVGNAEYSAAMRQGLGRAAAVQAMRDARRASAGSFAEMFIGPTVPAGFYGHLVEFGTRKAIAQPFMRPAWDATQREALDVIKAELASQIIASARRLGRSKRQSAEVKYRASLAALMAHEAGG